MLESKTQRGFTPSNNLPRQIASQRHLTGFTLIELVISIIVLSALIIGATYLWIFYRKMTNDKTRKAVMQEIVKQNKVYHDRTLDYASKIGDTNAKCLGAPATSLVGAGLMSCPKVKVKSGANFVSFDSLYTKEGDGFKIEIDLERGGKYACDQNGCH